MPIGRLRGLKNPPPIIKVLLQEPATWVYVTQKAETSKTSVGVTFPLPPCFLSGVSSLGLLGPVERPGKGLESRSGELKKPEEVSDMGSGIEPIGRASVKLGGGVSGVLCSWDSEEVPAMKSSSICSMQRLRQAYKRGTVSKQYGMVLI